MRRDPFEPVDEKANAIWLGVLMTVITGFGIVFVWAWLHGPDRQHLGDATSVSQIAGPAFIGICELDDDVHAKPGDFIVVSAEAAGKCHSIGRPAPRDIGVIIVGCAQGKPYNGNIKVYIPNRLDDPQCLINP